ncbi:hypothetical protein [Streptomyces coerulescens]|uniref:DUF2637 domain-containing protein n=1 Tax=Streptomyces coerulescens TaxID=29304 RepID=A0ABW0CNA6_STRCD
MRIASLLRDRGIGPDATPQPQPDAVTVAAAAASAHAAAQPPAAADDWWDALYADQTPATDAQSDADAAEESDGARSPWMRIPPWWSGRHVDTRPTAAPAEEEDADDVEEDQDDEPDELDHQDDDAEETDGLEDDAQPRTADTAARRRPAKPRSRTGAKRSRRSPARRTRPAPRALVDTPAAPRRSLLDAAAAVEPRIRWLILHSSAAAAGYALGWVDWSTRTSAWIDDHGWLNPSAIFWCLLALGCEALRHRARHARLPIRWVAAIPIASIVTGFAFYGVGWQTLDLGV